MLARGPRTGPHTCSGPQNGGPSMLAQGVLRACSGHAQACSGSAQACSPSAQVKAATAQVGGRTWNWEKNILCPTVEVFEYARVQCQIGVYSQSLYHEPFK